MLTVENLRVAYPGREGGLLEVVRGVSFTLGRERLAIVGESGSGKSQTGRAILGLSSPGAVVTADALRFDGIELLSAPPAQRRALRGQRIAMVLQDPKFALDPVMSIGAQIAETLHAYPRMRSGDAHQRTRPGDARQRVPAGEVRARVHAALAEVGIDDPERVARLYPHEVSGGMGQRAMIAMMLIAGPELLIADEPTSALDVTVQLQVLGILDRLVRERGMGLIFISHDLRLVASFCDRVLVMYAGRVVEALPASDLQRAQHPYTRGLLNCLPQLNRPRHPLPVLERQASWSTDEAPS